MAIPRRNRTKAYYSIFFFFFLSQPEEIRKERRVEKAWLAGICREIPDAHIYRESGEMNGRSTLQVDETRLEERTGRMEGGVNDNVAAFPTPGGCFWFPYRGTRELKGVIISIVTAL